MESVVDPGAWRGRRVFLTGHTGFMGGWLALWLSRLGAKVHGYSLAPPTEPNLFTLADVAAALDADVRADIRDVPRLIAAMTAADPEVVFHLAAQPLVLDSYRTPVDTFAVNVMGTAHVLEAARAQKGLAAVVVVTSDKCYANDDQGRAFMETDPLGGHDPYSASKAGAEIVTTAYRDSFFADGAAVASARAGNIIGGGDWAANRLIPDCVRAVAAREAVRLRHPQATRPWQHVLEAVSGYLVLGQRLLAGGRTYAGGWNFGPGTGGAATVGHVAEAIMTRLGGRVEHDSAASTPREARLLALDSTKAATHLGWRPHWPLPQALAETADWYSQFLEGKDLAAFTRRQIDRYAA